MFTFTSVFLKNYGLSLLMLASYFYIFLVCLLFNILFLYDTKKVKTLSDLQILNGCSFIFVTSILIFLSFAGIPPLLGFVSKFLIFNFLLILGKRLFFIYFLFLNFFSIYFYTQNLRFLIGKYQLNFFLIVVFYFYFNKPLVDTVVVSNLLNACGFLYAEDLIYKYLFMFTTKGLF